MNLNLINLFQFAKTVLPFLVSIVTFGVFLICYKYLFHKSKKNLMMYVVALIATAGCYFAFIEVCGFERWNYFLDGFYFIAHYCYHLAENFIENFGKSVVPLLITFRFLDFSSLFKCSYDLLNILRFIKHNKEIYISTILYIYKTTSIKVSCFIKEAISECFKISYVEDIKSLISVYNC